MQHKILQAMTFAASQLALLHLLTRLSVFPTSQTTRGRNIVEPQGLHRCARKGIWSSHVYWEAHLPYFDFFSIDSLPFCMQHRRQHQSVVWTVAETFFLGICTPTLKV